MGPTLEPSLNGLTSTISSKGIWMDFQGYDCFLSEFLEAKNGFMRVNFAVYSDGFEAKLDVSISDLNLPEGPQTEIPLKVYDMIRTSNSAITHSQAKSILFDHSNCTNYVAVFPTSEAEILLPLSRRVSIVPRESALAVDVSLFVNCNSQDISIMNGSVLFRAETRSNANVEEQIVTSNHGKVKVKVTWIDATEDVVTSKKEEEVEAVQEEEDVDDDAESEYISDDDCLVDSAKLRRLKSQEDISTRASEYLMIDPIETHNMGIVARNDNNSHRSFKHSLLEVFSVTVVSSESLSLDGIYGFITIYTGTPINLLFRRLHGDVSKINSKGSAILEVPRGFAWRVCGEVFILPFLFRYQDFGFKDGKVCQKYLWCDDDKYDKMLHKRFVIDVGSIDVRFAVYKDAVEAHLDVMLINCSFSPSEVYGTILVSNSMLKDNGAESVVFENEKIEDVNASVRSEKDLDVRVGSLKEMTLLLSRSIVALPIDSTLKLKFDLSYRDQPIGCRMVEIPVALTGVSKKTLTGNGCSVVVKVNFFHEEPSQTDCGESYF